MAEFTLPKVRLGYSKELFEPKVYPADKGGYSEWSCEILISPECQESEAFKALLAECQQLAVSTFRERAQFARLPFKRNHNNGNVPRGMEPGWVFSRLASKFPTKAVKRDNGIWRELTLQERSGIYSGCYLAVVVSPYAVVSTKEKQVAEGIFLGLRTIMKVADGATLEQEVDLDAAFGSIVTEQTAPAAVATAAAFQLPTY